jgi:hypothetical protein
MPAISVDTMLSVIVRGRLMVVSRWVWVLLALAVLWIVLAVRSVPGATISLDIAYGAFVAATPAIFAAALMYVAPQERLIRRAAFCFSFPIAVNLVIGAAILVSAQSLSPDYEYLPPRLASVGDAFRLIAWGFPIVAVFLIGAYVGPVLTRRGWLIVAVAGVAALLNAVLIVASQPEGVPIEHSFIGLLSRSVWLAWAYLLAVAIERRMFLVALASGAYLASSLIDLVSLGVFQDYFGDPGDPQTQALLGVVRVLGLVSWAAFIAGILRELPRSENELPTRRGTHQALSPTR